MPCAVTRPPPLSVALPSLTPARPRFFPLQVWAFGGVGVVADCIRTRGSLVVEVSADGGGVRKMPLRVQES